MERERERPHLDRSPATDASSDRSAEELAAARERILRGLDAADRVLDSIIDPEEVLQQNRQRSAQ